MNITRPLITGVSRVFDHEGESTKDYCVKTRIQLSESGRIMDHSIYDFPKAIILKGTEFPYNRRLNNFVTTDKLSRVIYICRFPLRVVRDRRRLLAETMYISAGSSSSLPEDVRERALRRRIPVVLPILVIRPGFGRFVIATDDLDPVTYIVAKCRNAFSNEPVEECIYDAKENCWNGTGRYYAVIRKDSLYNHH